MHEIPGTLTTGLVRQPSRAPDLGRSPHGQRSGAWVVRLAAIAAAAVLLSAPFAVEAQQAGKVYRIGILADRAADSNEILAWQTFRDGLREHGWKEGVNIRIESRWVEGDVARLSQMAADLHGSPEGSDILDSHRVPRPRGSGGDRPCREPRQTRRQHHGDGGPSD